MILLPCNCIVQVGSNPETCYVQWPLFHFFVTLSTVLNDIMRNWTTSPMIPTMIDTCRHKERLNTTRIQLVSCQLAPSYIQQVKMFTGEKWSIFLRRILCAYREIVYSMWRILHGSVLHIFWCAKNHHFILEGILIPL